MSATEPLVTPAEASTFPFPERPSPRSPSRARPFIAGLLLIVLGLLAAASVFASRSYRHAPTPAPTTPLYHQQHGPVQGPPAPGQQPDRC